MSSVERESMRGAADGNAMGESASRARPDAGKKRRGRIIGAALMTAILAGGALAVIGAGAKPVVRPDKSVKSAQAKTADRAPVRTLSFQISTKAGGELEARNQIEIRSRLESQSTIVELAPEGKTVKAGELLVRLNSDKIEQDILEQTLQVESARAELVAAENGYDIQLNENESKLRQARSKVTLAELGLQQWEKGDVAKKRLELTLAMDRAKRDHARLEEKVTRSRKLHEQGFLSKNELDLDEISYVEAVAAVKKAEKDNEIYENYKYLEEKEITESELTEAKAELDRVRMNNEIELASKEAARTNRRKQLAVREEKLKDLKEQLEASTMRAPSDGLVVYSTSMNSGGRGGWGGGNEGPLQIGRQVFPNELLMVLPDTSEMMASVRVQESLAGRIRKGQPAAVTVDAAGGRTFVGAVESTSVLAESGGWRDPNLREYTVKIALDQTQLEDAGLKPSMRVDATITMGDVENALSVPVQAVFNEGQVRYVYLEQGSKFVKTPVRMGRRSDTFAEIAAGLSEGDTVLLREPSPGEVINLPWDAGKLEIAGYILNDDGQPVLKDAPRGGPPGGPGGRRGAPTGNAGAPTAGKSGPSAGAAAPTSVTTGGGDKSRGGSGSDAGAGAAAGNGDGKPSGDRVADSSDKSSDSASPAGGKSGADATGEGESATAESANKKGTR